MISPTELDRLRGKSYAAVAGRILAPFCLGDDVTDTDLAQMLDDVYGPNAGIFAHPDIAPLRKIGDDFYLLELFHGPTLAFKDIALQFLARMFTHLSKKRSQPITIIGATSGDTGSAAIHACAHIPNARVFILHPQGRVSDIQRRQMTTHPGQNIYNIAIDGTFDDCQKLVKDLFDDQKTANDFGLVAINSINWLRIIAQSVYYMTASLSLGSYDRGASFAVPTGNFGNVFAGHVARTMGAPIGDLIIGSNRNDILYRFFQTGEMAVDSVVPSLSPSMDIQISSNFERFLFQILNENHDMVDDVMRTFKRTGKFTLHPSDYQKAADILASYRADDDETLKTIKTIYDETGIIIDPHTAVGVHAARQHQVKTGKNGSMVALACAHPAKFPDTVKQAIGIEPPLPGPISHLKAASERVTPMRNDLNILRNYIHGIVAA